MTFWSPSGTDRSWVNAGWASDRVSADGYRWHWECIEGFVYDGTSTYGSPTWVPVELLDGEPPLEVAGRVVEVALSGNGHLTLVNWEPSEVPVARLELPQGQLVLGISSFGLAGTAAIGALSPEWIRFQIWPGLLMKPGY